MSEMTSTAKLASDAVLLSGSLTLANEAFERCQRETEGLELQLERKRAELTAARQVRAQLTILDECIQNRKLYVVYGRAMICKVWGFGDTGYIEPTNPTPAARFIQELWGDHRREAVVFPSYEEIGNHPRWCIGYVSDPFNLTDKFLEPDMTTSDLGAAVEVANRWVAMSHMTQPRWGSMANVSRSEPKSTTEG